MEAFVHALQAGALGQVWGVSMPTPSTSAPLAGAAVVQAQAPAATGASMQNMLQRAGWSIVMKGSGESPTPAPAAAGA